MYRDNTRFIKIALDLDVSSNSSDLRHVVLISSEGTSVEAFFQEISFIIESLHLSIDIGIISYSRYLHTISKERLMF